MKVLILGGSGLVGGYIFSQSQALGLNPVGTTREAGDPTLLQLDLRDESALVTLIEREQPDIIFHAAAQANVEYCEDHPEESRAVNVEPVQSLVKILKGTKTRIVFFSSDYVFDGQHGPYRENDTPRAINEYARQKLECEQILQSELPTTSLIPRITVVYGWERQGKNFVTRLIQTLKRGETMRAPIDQIGSPSYAANVAQAAIELATQGQHGIFHTSGPELMDRFEFSKVACEVFGLDANLLQRVTTPELKQKAARPLNAGMIVEKAQALLSFSLLAPRAGLEAMRDEVNRWSILKKQ